MKQLWGKGIIFFCIIFLGRWASQKLVTWNVQVQLKIGMDFCQEWQSTWLNTTEVVKLHTEEKKILLKVAAQAKIRFCTPYCHGDSKLSIPAQPTIQDTEDRSISMDSGYPRKIKGNHTFHTSMCTQITARLSEGPNVHSHSPGPMWWTRLRHWLPLWVCLPRGTAEFLPGCAAAPRLYLQPCARGQSPYSQSCTALGGSWTPTWITVAPVQSQWSPSLTGH